MLKIESLHEWSADVALKSAIDDIEPNDKVLIVCQKENGDRFFRSANFTHEEMLFEFKRIKLRELFELKGGTCSYTFLWRKTYAWNV